jgi:GR25 family glycosyltransferase involved in LPS biosynthesis
MKLDNYFSKIYVINLYDKKERWVKVKKQFDKKKIHVSRFIAVDGRCMDQGDDGCIAKLKTFEMIYNVKIPMPKGMKLTELVPASSLTIGTILILRDMVKRRLPRILICEDDIELTRDFEKKFERGIKSLEKIRKYNWDLLYLGCGDRCGTKGISERKRGNVKNLSILSQYIDEDYYVQNKNDLRGLCDECNEITPYISDTIHPGGTWCYAYSLKGARKVLKLMDNNAGNHIDQIVANQVEDGRLIAYAFDPPIVMHEDISNRDATTSIPWSF